MDRDLINVCEIVKNGINVCNFLGSLQVNGSLSPTCFKILKLYTSVDPKVPLFPT